MLKNDPIRNMLAIGAVTTGSARIWMRVERPGRYRLCWSAATGGRKRHVDVCIQDVQRDLTACVTLHGGIRPDTRYRVILRSLDDQPLATGRFTTAPDRNRELPAQFSIALLSCHQPFDGAGHIAPATEPMLEAVERAFLEHRVRLVVMAGDQLYSDYPPQASLFDPAHFHEVAPAGRSSLLDCTAQEVRQLFHERYRHFWNVRGWRQLLASYPCYPILDDHEIVDNWGSAEAHATGEWQNFREGAFKAYADYQGSRVADAQAALPDSFDYDIDFADVSLHVMDLRSNRRVGDDPQLVSPAQIEALRHFLETRREQSALFLVLSVPLLHLPTGLSRLAARITPDGEDFSDRWSSRGHRRDRDRVLHLLHQQQALRPRQRLVLLSGDIHIGCVHEIHWQDLEAPLYQFVSSGVTHDAGRFIQGISSAIIRANRQITVDTSPGEPLRARLQLLEGETGAHQNPCGRLNVGIIEIRRPAPDEPPTLRFLLYSHDGPRPACLYRSAPVACAAPAFSHA